MLGILKVISAERLKMSRSYMMLLVLVSPIIAFVVALMATTKGSPDPWSVLVGAGSMAHSLLFMPIMSGIFAAFICRYEHSGGGWKQLLVLPVTRWRVYLAKFTVVVGLLALTQLLYIVAVFFAGLLQGIHAPIPWEMIVRSLLGGWLACFPLAALQLAGSLLWNSFAAPLALNVMFTIPNMLVVNSKSIAPFYPWAQPFLATIPAEAFGDQSFGALNLPFQNLMITVLGSFIVFFTLGWIYFSRKEV